MGPRAELPRGVPLVAGPMYSARHTAAAAPKGTFMDTATSAAAEPTPALIFETLNAHTKSAALRTAIELDLFRAIGDGVSDIAGLARHAPDQRHRNAERAPRRQPSPRLSVYMRGEDADEPS